MEADVHPLTQISMLDTADPPQGDGEAEYGTQAGDRNQYAYDLST